jgi:hypothetical protein
MWVVENGRTTNPFIQLPVGESEVMRADHFSIRRIKHLPNLTIYLLGRSAPRPVA